MGGKGEEEEKSLGGEFEPLVEDRDYFLKSLKVEDREPNCNLL